MAQFLWINLTPGVPIVGDFTSTAGNGTPICIDQTTGVAYYLGPGDVVTPLAGGSGGGGGCRPMVTGDDPPVFIIDDTNDLIMTDC